MKTQKIERLLRVGEVYHERTVITLAMSEDFYKTHVLPLHLEAKSLVRDVDYNQKGELELLVKVFNSLTNHLTARFLRKAFVHLRRRGLKTKPRIYPIDSRATRLDFVCDQIYYAHRSEDPIKVGQAQKDHALLLKDSTRAWPLRRRKTNLQVRAELQAEERKSQSTL